jgi:hypothetical protein
MRAPAPRLILPILAATLIVATGCGAETKPHPHSSRLTAIQVAQTHAAEMVLAAGSLPGFTLHSKGAETLNEQLPPKGQAGAAPITRLVTANWLASAHSFIFSPGRKLYIYSDANLFRSSAIAAHIDKLERRPTPGLNNRFLSPPADAPPGAHLFFARRKTLSAYTLVWAQGSVMAYVTIYGHPHWTFTQAIELRVATLLATAANAQAARIAHVEGLGNLPT